jgi:hypothetical protein
MSGTFRQRWTRKLFVFEIPELGAGVNVNVEALAAGERIHDKVDAGKHDGGGQVGLNQKVGADQLVVDLAHELERDETDEHQLGELAAGNDDGG